MVWRDGSQRSNKLVAVVVREARPWRVNSPGAAANACLSCLGAIDAVFVILVVFDGACVMHTTLHLVLELLSHDNKSILFFLSGSTIVRNLVDTS